AVGEKVAFDLVATGRTLSASEARSVGLISRVFSDAEFETETATVLEELASTSSTTLALIKRQLYELEGRSFADAIKLGSEVNALARGTSSFKEAVARFLKK
ncbi:MAG: enoyl-CoA hydratase/isomerase family protein, partial [Gemmatimonadales bacterium]